MSPSSSRLFQTCARKFSYRYRYGIEGKRQPSDKLRFGSAFAKTLELNAGRPVADWSVREAAAGLEPDLSAQLAGATAAYAIHWDGTVTYRATELKLETELRNPRLTYTTILDGLVEDDAGRLVVIDQKTTESDIRPGSWFWEKLQLDVQVSSYIWAARKHGHAVEHAVWDAVKRPTFRRRAESVPPEYYARSGKWGDAGSLKPGTGVPEETLPEYARRVRDTMLGAPDVYFQRAPVVRLDDELDAAIEDVEQVGKQILNAWDTDEFPRNSGACFQYGEKCEFWDLCTGSAQPTDDQLYQIRRKR